MAYKYYRIASLLKEYFLKEYFRHTSGVFKLIVCRNFFQYEPTCKDGIAIGNSSGNTDGIIS